MGRLSPNLIRPRHFAQYADCLDRGVGSGLRVVFDAPPQHGKTATTIHGLVNAARLNQSKRFAYITYSTFRTLSVARSVRRLLILSGVTVTGTLHQMLLPGGGHILFTSIDGGITGEPVDGFAIIDDYVKNRKEADSRRRREVIRDAYRDAIETRVHPGASIFVLATRWHPDDLSATLIAEEGWQHISLPAIAENDNDPLGRKPGDALFPELWSAEDLAKKRKAVGEFTWAALYQGRPRPRGGRVFHDPSWYRVLPAKGIKGAFGVDLAYTARTNADWSVCVEMLREDRPNEDPIYYVVRVDRAQVEAPSFAMTLKARHAAATNWPMLWRASGTEKGAAQFIRRQGIPLMVRNPPGDKFVAAQDIAAAWNDGRVLLPDPIIFKPPWIHDFLDVVTNFTGVGAERDDDVDALGSAMAALEMASAGAGAVGAGNARSGSRIA